MDISLPIINQTIVAQLNKDQKIKTLIATSGNYKLDYSMKKSKVLIASLSLQPAYKVSDQSGRTILNTCSWATQGCKSICVLDKTGMSVFKSVKDVRKAKTQLLAHNPDQFYKILVKDFTRIINSVKNKAKKSKKKANRIFCRLNTASDIEWQTKFPQLFKKFPNITFYDYTKATHRFKQIQKAGINNYHLSYSVNQNSNNDKIQNILQSGDNVVVVFDTFYSSSRKDKLPQQYSFGGKKYKVVDGDISDIRTKQFDGSGVVIGLRSKGGAKNRQAGIDSGFVRMSKQ